MVKNNLPAEMLDNYMSERGLVGQDGKKVIAERTESSVRSVERWLQYGIPKPKWALLQINK